MRVAQRSAQRRQARGRRWPARPRWRRSRRARRRPAPARRGGTAGWRRRARRAVARPASPPARPSTAPRRWSSCRCRATCRARCRRPVGRQVIALVGERQQSLTSCRRQRPLGQPAPQARARRRVGERRALEHSRAPGTPPGLAPRARTSCGEILAGRLKLPKVMARARDRGGGAGSGGRARPVAEEPARDAQQLLRCAAPRSSPGGIGPRVGEAPVDRVQAGGVRIAEVGHLHRRAARANSDQPVVRGMAGEIDQDVDAVGAQTIFSPRRPAPCRGSRQRSTAARIRSLKCVGADRVGVADDLQRVAIE